MSDCRCGCWSTLKGKKRSASAPPCRSRSREAVRRGHRRLVVGTFAAKGAAGDERAKDELGELAVVVDEGGRRAAFQKREVEMSEEAALATAGHTDDVEMAFELLGGEGVAAPFLAEQPLPGGGVNG